MLVDGAIGTAVGTGVGGMITAGLVVANVSLFIASAVVGASAGAGDNQGRFADLIRDAIKAGDVVLVAETHSEEQTAIAREVIDASVGEYKDLSLT